MENSEGRLPAGWKVGPKLGQGGFATVYRCQDSKGRNLPLAAKTYTVTDDEIFQDVKNELKVLKKLKHERIVQYYQEDSEGKIFYIIMEYIRGGSLADQVKNFGCLTESRTRRYTRQILEGLHYLHSQEIIHRDLKGRNIMLDDADNVKLCDFGISRILYPEGTLSGALSERVGTLYYMSPEMLREQGYGRRTDIWSLGCTIVEMLSGHPPWYKMSYVRLMRKVADEEGPIYELDDRVSDTARNMLELCFTWNKNKRPYTGQLLKHKFVHTRKRKHRRCHIL